MFNLCLSKFQVNKNEINNFHKSRMSSMFFAEVYFQVKQSQGKQTISFELKNCVLILNKFFR